MSRFVFVSPVLGEFDMAEMIGDGGSTKARFGDLNFESRHVLAILENRVCKLRKFSGPC